jgi:hypothetical protein
MVSFLVSLFYTNATHLMQIKHQKSHSEIGNYVIVNRK